MAPPAEKFKRLERMYEESQAAVQMMRAGVLANLDGSKK